MIRILFLLLFLVTSIASLSAQELIKGMTMRDVLSSKEWGVPSKKMHYETSRKERWYYDDERYVEFESGAVSTWKSSQTLSYTEDEQELTLPSPVAGKGTSTAPLKNDTGTSVNAFLREVEKENGTDDGSDDPKARKPRRRR